ncbi:MAG: nitrite reductase (NAD(P)H) small subunit [Acetobacteraceae bacterium]|nr:nitrite reductase (NAD(P)H) small subunit [Acetobacteraceae bacterium]MBV8520904.1 nitrite reductase (NAD(P)H) small subunit [Acetobacteraceae bacterium]MBV8588660.1 nitrite reductase (NAD(P)H) small subunit [Acetobacteraceae bacterium]
MTERAIGKVWQIPKGEGRNFAVDGMEIAVFHTRSGELFATQPDCPHRNGPLADGLVGESIVVCPLHDRVYDLRTGVELNTDCRIRTYPVRMTADGTILLIKQPAEIAALETADGKTP